MLDVLLVAVGLVGGALLTVLGGQLQDHIRYRRRRRVAARIVLDDLIGNLFLIHLESEVDDPTPRPAEISDQLEIDLSRWDAHEATFAEVRQVEKFELLRDAYQSLDLLPAFDPKPVNDWAYQQHLAAGGEPGWAISRQEEAPSVIEKLEAAARVVGKWAGYRSEHVERLIADATPEWVSEGEESQ